VTPGAWPRRDPQRLLWIGDTVRDRLFVDLPDLLEPGDLLVLNDAATLPGSLRGDGIELRLLGFDHRGWRAVLFGEGDWRDNTDHRPAPPSVEVFKVGDLEVSIVDRDPRTPRLVTVTFDRVGPPLWEALYRLGRPVQYSYLHSDLPLSAVQTVYASRPWAAEMPSAGRPITWNILSNLRDRGIGLASLTHAAGLSATGDPVVDALLPLPESYDISESTVKAIGEARRVIAVGTSVVRALEGNFASNGRLVAGVGLTDLIIDRDFERRVVHGLLSGMHEPEETHFRLHEAFAPTSVLLDSYSHAVDAGYKNHEFGDSTLIIPRRPAGSLR